MSCSLLNEGVNHTEERWIFLDTARLYSPVKQEFDGDHPDQNAKEETRSA